MIHYDYKMRSKTIYLYIQSEPVLPARLASPVTSPLSPAWRTGSHRPDTSAGCLAAPTRDITLKTQPARRAIKVSGRGVAGVRCLTLSTEARSEAENLKTRGFIFF